MFGLLSRSIGSTWLSSSQLSNEMISLDNIQRRAASLGGIRDQKKKTIEELRRKRQSQKDAKQKRQETGFVFDKAVAQAHQEIADERLYEERKRMYGVEVASQMLEEDRLQRDLEAWNERRFKLRNKARPPKLA